jgi:hypothetical protein
MDMQGSAEWHATILRRWHPSLLRFAVTRDNADQLAVFAIANEIDGLGRHHRDRPNFEFFRKTSSKLCEAILLPSDAAETALRQYLAQIDNVRLKRALSAALEIADRAPEKRLSKQDADLWRGLAPRGVFQR